MQWYLIALIPPLLWSIVNYTDKYLITKYFKGGSTSTLVIFSSLIGFAMLPIFFIINPNLFQKVSFSHLIVFINGIIYITAVIPYFKALSLDNASITVPLFQLIPLYAYLLGSIFLGETLNTIQLIGGLITISGSILIVLDLDNLKKLKFKWNVFGLMSLSSFLYALNFVIFKYFAIDLSFVVTSFYEYLGLGCFGLVFLIISHKHRKDFFTLIKENSVQVLSLNTFNEIVNIIAKVISNLVSVNIMIVLTWLINGVQSFFVFIIGIILAMVVPSFSDEKFILKVFIQKLVSIIIMSCGIYLIVR